MNLYGDDTYELIQQLAHENLDIAEKDGVVVLSVSDAEFEAMLPTEDELVKGVLLRPRQDRESLKELAERYGVANSTISAVMRRDARRKVKRNLALCAIMLMDPLPDVEEADHMLMELSHPGLYVSTGMEAVNRRNWVLREILKYGSSHPRPKDGWLDVANYVLTCFGMLPLNDHSVAEPVGAPSATKLEQWKGQLQAVSWQDYSILRECYLNRYMEKEGLTYYGGTQKAYARLAKKAIMSPDTVRALFAPTTNKNSIGNRDNLINLAIALGCSLKEANTMLLQANKALLYPNRSVEIELKWTQLLCQNNPVDLR